MANETKIYVGEQGAKALYKRLKEQLGKITTYQKVTNVTPEGVPIVAKPNTRTIYLVKDETVIGDDRYKEWIWNSVDLWECIGTTSIPENAWKQWSEDNGSSGEGDSVYIGKNNVLGRDESYSLGKNNTVEVTDDTVYVGTDVVEIGTSNAAMNAANAYQLGRENTVFGHNISYADPTLHGLALNVGRNNTITSEGVNLGKDNAASYFGVSIGQRNEANHAAYSIGNRVYANNASFAIGNGESNVLTSTITLASYQLSDSTYVHVSQFRQKTPYTYCKLGAIYFNETTGKYEWIPIDDYGRTAIAGGNSLSLLVNDDLKTYLSIWNGYSGAGKVVGYFDANGNFVADSSNPASKTYYKVVSVDLKNGGYTNRTFYASMKDDTWPKSISNLKTYVGRPNPNYKYPDPGTILNEAQYAELRQNTIQLVGAYNDVYINPNDLSGTVYRSSNGYYPVIGDYEVYGFDKDNEFVPYNEITGKDVQPADCYWKTVTIDKIGTHAFKYADVFDEPVRIKSDNNSIVLSNGIADIDEHSIALVSNVYSAKVDIRGEQKSSSGFTNISFTVGTLDQATGRASWNSSITMQCPNVVGSSDYTNTIALPKAVVDDDSIGIIGAGSTTYSRVTGASIGIGSGLTVQGYSFGIGRGSTVSSASYSIGNNNNVSSKSFVFGQDNTSIREESIALGFLNYEIGDFYIGESRYYGRAVALGYNNRQVAQQSVAIGTNNSTVYYNSVCLGSNHNTVKDSAVSIGVGNSRISSASIAIGSGLYDIEGSSICFGMGSTASSASFVVGNGCAGSSAIVMGMGAKGYGGSIVLGNGSAGRNGAVILGIGNNATESNTSVNPSNFYANAVVLGIGNQVRNVRESLNKNGWTSLVTTCGIAIGSYIKGYGHNFISLGCRNTLGDPDRWNADSRSTVTDNDGFMTAIGFDCVAFRNYDFAYGYHSVANGGENIAFQHSSAIGYRNIAMVDSNVQNTIASAALCESDLLATATDIKDNGVLHNLLFHSKVACVRNFNSSILFNTKLNVTNSGNGFSRNIFDIGTMNHVVNLDLQGYGSVANNILIGAKNGEYLGTWSDHGSINLSTNTSISRNVLLNNAYQSLNTIYACVDNMIRSSEINIVSGAVKTFADNFIDCSGLEMTYGSNSTNIIGNVLHGRSKLYVPNTSVAGFHYNFLLNSILGSNTGTPTSTKYGQENTRNFLFNAAAYNADSCFCMSLGGGVSSRGDGIQQGVFNRSDYNNFTQSTPGSVLADCIGVFNFGDGVCISSANSVNFGHNKMSDSSGNFIAGLNNIAIGRYGSPYSLTNVRIFGNDNNVNNLSSGSDVGHLTVIGDTNTINTGVNCGENTIIGSLNYFVEPYNIQTLTPAQVETPLSQRNYYKVSEPCIMPDGDNTYYNKLTYVNTTYYYVRYGNRVASISSDNPLYAATTPVQTSPSNFQYMYNAGTLPVGVYYQMTSSGNINAIPSGILLLPGVVYDLGPYNSTYNTRYSVNKDIQIALNRGIVGNSPVSHNSRNTIIGSVNGICSRVVDYTILGSQNTVKCTSGFTASDNYAISNGFVQGNDNDIRNGSNIVTMGNGNVSTGHNSVAIGCQLISNQWQTVLGKYNAAIAGPNRLASETPQDPTKALLIVGNGYSSKDDYNWQDESFITRSNALELYADGRLKISGKIEASNIPPAPVADGQYALACEVVSGVATYRWVAVGTT